MKNPDPSPIGSDKPRCCAPSACDIDTGQFWPSDIDQSIIKAVGPPRDLIKLPGGWFRMGANDGPHPEDGEGPVRQVWVDAFSISPITVTNAQFAAFVAATGYKTQAEQTGTSFVFYLFLADELKDTATAQHAPWWHAIKGACWHSPDGPGSDVNDKPDHPVVHMAYIDALAFCQWTGCRLPSEAEWEFSARGGLEGKSYPWGDELEAGNTHHANVWQGQFPGENSAADGFVGTAPAQSFEPNGYGLFNVIGNVWEWTADRFTRLHAPRQTRNPKGPLNGSQIVAKGGSYLCHTSYCARYRTSSRQALSPDTTTGNVGFRIAGK